MVNDPSLGYSESNDRRLDALQEELDLARAGESEAERLVNPSKS